MGIGWSTETGDVMAEAHKALDADEQRVRSIAYPNDMKSASSQELVAIASKVAEVTKRYASGGRVRELGDGLVEAKKKMAKHRDNFAPLKVTGKLIAEIDDIHDKLLKALIYLADRTHLEGACPYPEGVDISAQCDPVEGAPDYYTGAEEQKETSGADVTNPSHYRSHPSGIECIQITEHMNFNLGNAVKYIWRAGLKSDATAEDLAKARWYLDREIKRISS